MRFASQEHVHRLEAYAALTAHAKTRCRIWLDQQRRELVKELKAGDVFVLDFLSYLARHGNELSSTDTPSYMLSVKFYNRCRNHAMKSRSCEYKTTQCNCRAEHYWPRPRFRGPVPVFVAQRNQATHTRRNPVPKRNITASTCHRGSRRTKRRLGNRNEIPDFQKLKIEIELRIFYRNKVALSGIAFDGFG